MRFLQRSVVVISFVGASFSFSPLWASASDPVGALAVSPESGTDQSSIYVITAGPCPAGNSVIARMYGAGFPEHGQIVVGNAEITAFDRTSVGGIRLPLAETLRDLENLQDNPQRLAGDYKIVVTCRDKIDATPRGEFVGHLFFSKRSYTSTKTHVVTDKVAQDVSTGQVPDNPALGSSGGGTQGVGPGGGALAGAASPSARAVAGSESTSPASNSVVGIVLLAVGLGAVGASGWLVVRRNLSKKTRPGLIAGAGSQENR